MSNALVSRRRAFVFLSSFGAVVSFRSLARAASCTPTMTDVKGPFYRPGAPHRMILAAPDEPGDRLVVRGTVTADDCTPLSAALLDVWQADANGVYHYEKENDRLRGQLFTDKPGSFEFTTIMPGRYKQDGGYRPAHIHFTISHPGCEPVTTQLYFKGDPYLAPHDSCGDECKSADAARIVELRKSDVGKAFSATFPAVLKRRPTEIL